MPNLRQGSIHLFQVAGIDLYLHWSWFVVAAIEIQSRQGRYSSVLWNFLEYLALFLIVMLHEFGHALACRQVGGTANRIMLWPLGGVAYVNPPQRPGATLWSIAAGPLVNVALLPVLGGAFLMSRSLDWAHTMPNAYQLTLAVLSINLGLLIFNILPFYPLDGGQILRSLLWFVLGRARSLMLAIAISIFMLMNCWDGLRHAQALLRIAKLPRRQGFVCPSCRMAPPAGAYWQCGACRQTFDTFATQGVCPHCGAEYNKTMCLDCQEQRPMSEWIAGAAAGVGEVNGGIPIR